MYNKKIEFGNKLAVLHLFIKWFIEWNILIKTYKFHQLIMNHILPNNKVGKQKGGLKPSIAPSPINGRFLSPMTT